jgi:CHAT domain-containing protein
VIARPAAELLGSLVSEEWRGRPGPAHERALASARDDPAHRAYHLLDATYASLISGEPRLALRTLEGIDRADDAPEVPRRVAACRAWALQLDENWYPGNAGAELREGARERLSASITVGADDSETRLLEACVADGPLPLFTNRNLIETFARQVPLAVDQMLGVAVQQIDRFKTVVETSGAASTNLWAWLMAADLTARAGHRDAAIEQLPSIRDVYHELEDRIGLSATSLIEGDWWATPGSAPEALGFDLAPMQPRPPDASPIDTGKAAAAYRSAGALLQGLDAPRCTGALALRRAALAWRERRFQQQIMWLDTAHQAFTDAGDVAACHLTVVHRLLADIARGDFEPARRAAPSEWAATPHGPVGRIVEWAVDRGSISFCGGLGRLLQRAAESWVAAGELERAEYALLLALPLLSTNDAVHEWAILRALGEVDLRRNIPVRPLVRCLGALARMPADAGTSDAMKWLQQVEMTASLVAIPTAMSGSSTSTAIRALERGVERLTALLAAPAVAATAFVPRRRIDRNSSLRDISARQAQLTLEDVAEQSKTGTLQVEGDLIGIGVQAVRDQIAVANGLIALNHARRAERAGWQVEAERWYEEALTRIDSEDPKYAWMAVLILGAWGRREEARARFDRIRASGALPLTQLAPLALRAGAHETSDQLFGELPADATTGWSDLSDHAEAALGSGDPRRALDFALRGIAQFEAAVARLSRDSDRIAATDDIGAASVYQLAARACLALADAPELRDQPDQRIAWKGRSFEIGEQARSLTLRILMRELADSGASSEPRFRRLHQAATERSTAYDRLLAAHERNDLEEVRRRETQLAAAEAVLAEIESDIGPRRAEPWDAAHVSPQFTVADAQRALPPDGCVIAYHMVGRDFMRWGVSARSIEASHERFPRHIVEGLISRLLQACSAGDPGDEAPDLARVLLDPFKDLLAAHQRVVVIPFGPLSAVPFHALPFGDQPLGATHVLSYLPAASLLGQTALDDPLSGYGAVVVGDPAFNPDTNIGLRRLPGAQLEATIVGKQLRARDVLIDTDAVEQRIRSLLQGRAVLHFAAHGHLDEIATNTSAIVLAGDDRLTVADLIGLRVDAGLAVLSACDTGRGSAILGGDVVGLVRGLFAAGVRRSVVSLWPVDDVVACVTMVAFYQELIKGEPPAVALAVAQRAVRGMSATELAARYRELGGEARPGARSLRRLSGAPDPAIPTIPLDPEFIDTDESEDVRGTVLEGRLACAWAPFVLIGC